MAAPPPPAPAILLDELVEECLLRLSQEDPADLARAALVSRQWHRVVTGAAFRRRYIEFHRSAPLLGAILPLELDFIRFVPVSPSLGLPRAHRRGMVAVHSSHGRVLLYSDWYRELEVEVLEDGVLEDLCLFVWDPIWDKEWELPVLVSTRDLDPDTPNWEAAVVCAGGDGCSHLDCHFKVVVVVKTQARMFSCFYSSETGSWSDRVYVSWGDFGGFVRGSILVGNTLYFRRLLGSHVGVIIVEYDLPTHQMRMTSLQCEAELGYLGQLIAAEDGRLGIAMVTSNTTLRLWLREQGRLAESRVIQLDALLPHDALYHPLTPHQGWLYKPQAVAFAETGAGVIFLWTRVGYFTIDLNSGRSKKLGATLGSNHAVPYVSFCTPARGIVSTDEESGSSVV